MRSIRLLLACTLTVLVAGCAADPDLDDTLEFDDIADSPEEPGEGGKADQPDLRMRALDLAVPAAVGDAEIRLLVRSNAAYRALFGSAAPAVDFSRQWVAFYSAGRKPSGGYAASIDRVWTSASGRTLRVATRLVAPGPDCNVTLALTRPHAAVAFDRPRVTPSQLRAYHEDVVQACEAPCKTITPTPLAGLDLGVTRQVRAIYFTPSDRPFADCVGERLDVFAHLAQDFFRDEEGAHGYLGADGEGRTFALDTAADGSWNVVYMIGEHPAAYYQGQADAPGAAMAEMFARVPASFHERNVTLYIYDLAVVADRTIRFSGNGGSGAPWEGEGTGYVLQGAHFLGLPGFSTLATDPAGQAAMFVQPGDAGVDDYNGDQAFGPMTRGQYASTYVGAALHELGHAFYLDHTFTDHDGDGIETNLMGNGFRRLGGRYHPGSYQPATELGPDHAAQLSAAYMFQR